MYEIIKTENLTKNYSDVKAVNALNLTVKKGEIYGFLGLNGAGKTTTIRMILGMIKPSNGEVFINNKPVRINDSKLWNEIGYLVETPYSYPNLTVRENLELIRKLRNIADNESVDRVMTQLHLHEYAKRRAKNLSLGNKQRLGLAKAMIHNPQLLILDEPTNGLDPAGIHEIRELFINLVENEGVTILISSHILGEISRFATRIGIIHQGNLIQEINTTELEKLCNKRLNVRCYNLENAMEVLRMNGYSLLNQNNSHLEITDQTALDAPEKIASILFEANCPPSLLKVEEEDLESYFLRIIQQKNNSHE